MVDDASELGVLGIGLVDVEQRDLGSQQCRIACRLDQTGRGGKQPDPPGTGTIDIIPEGTGKVDVFELVRLSSPLLQKELQTGGDGRFCELNFTDVSLSQGNGVEEGEAGSVEKSAAGRDFTKVKSGGNGIHEATATDSARFDLADDMAVELMIGNVNGADGAGGGVHSLADSRALKGRAGSGGGAEDLVAVAHDDLAVGT